jgi:hypothetical protein
MNLDSDWEEGRFQQRLADLQQPVDPPGGKLAQRFSLRRGSDGLLQNSRLTANEESLESLSKTFVFERSWSNGKVRAKSGLNRSQNPFLISASQNVRVRLSFERVHDHQTEKDRSPSRAGEAATSAGRAESRASAIIRYGRDHIETDADWLCPCVDRRPEPSFAARCTERSGMRKDFH